MKPSLTTRLLEKNETDRKIHQHRRPGLAAHRCQKNQRENSITSSHHKLGTALATDASRSHLNYELMKPSHWDFVPYSPEFRRAQLDLAGFLHMKQQLLLLKDSRHAASVAKRSSAR